jgi:hypothetical protein
MKTLDIINYNRQVLGKLSIDPNGQLELEILERGYHLAFDALMREILQAPLPLRTYERVFLPDRARLETRVRHLTPADPDFLWAVKDYLKRHRLGDTPVVGRIVDIPTRHSSGASASAGK